jgi:hypothetical protein
VMFGALQLGFGRSRRFFKRYYVGTLRQFD